MHTNTPATTPLPPRRGRPPYPVKAVRVNVLKPGTKSRTVGARKRDLTCVYLSGSTVLTLLALADGDQAVVNEAVRRAAVGVRVKEGSTVSETVIKRAKSLLLKYRRALDEAQALAEKEAALNNAAWEGV